LFWARDPITGDFGAGRLSKIDESEYHLMIERITRGLFYHEFNDVLPSQIAIAATRYKDFKSLAPFMSRMRTRRLGVQFSYSFMSSQEVGTDSVWLYEFHRSECVMALTGDLCHVALPEFRARPSATSA
jgi:hypothetical protein